MAASKHWGWMDLWAAFHLPIPWDSEPWVEGRWRNCCELSMDHRYLVGVFCVWRIQKHTFCKLMWGFSAANTCWKLWPSLPGATILHGWLYLRSGAQGLSKNLGTGTNDLSSFSKCHFGASPFLAKQTSSRGIATASLMDVEVAFQDVCAICGIWDTNQKVKLIYTLLVVLVSCFFLNTTRR